MVNMMEERSGITIHYIKSIFLPCFAPQHTKCLILTLFLCQNDLVCYVLAIGVYNTLDISSLEMESILLVIFNRRRRSGQTVRSTKMEKCLDMYFA